MKLVSKHNSERFAEALKLLCVPRSAWHAQQAVATPVGLPIAIGCRPFTLPDSH
jgi:hypothetical protein